MIRRLIVSCLVLAAVCLMPLTAEAKAKKPKADAKGKSEAGTVVSVAADGGSFVIHTGSKKKTGSDKTLSINASTTIQINGASAKAGELTAGMHVKVSVSGNAAKSITVESTKSKKKKK